MAVEFGVLISAANEASQELAKVEGDYGRAAATITRGSQDIARQTQAAGREFAQTARTVRLLTSQVATEFNPALGLMISTMSQASGEARRLGVAKGALLAAVAAAAIGLSQYIRETREAARVTAALDQAARRLDFSAATAQLDALIRKQQEFAAFVPQSILEVLRTLEAHLTGTQGGVNLLERFLGKVDPKLIEQARETAIALFPFEQVKRTTDEAIRLNEVLQQQRQIRAEIATEQADEARFLDQLREQEKLHEQQIDLLRTRLTVESQIRAAQLESLGLTALIPAIYAELGQQLTNLDERTQAFFERMEQLKKKGLLDIRTRLFSPLPSETNPFAEEEEGIRVGEEAVHKIRVERRQIEVETAGILSEQVNLTAQQRVELQLQVVAAQRALELQEARGEKAKEDIANLRALAAQQRIVQEELARTDPVEGMRRGIRTLTEEWSAAGRVMEGATQQTAYNISQAFSSALRGEGENIGRQFSNAMLRTITDAIAQYVTGNVFRSLFQLLPGGAGPYPLGSQASPVMLATLAQQATVPAPGTYRYGPGRGYVDPLTGSPVADPTVGLVPPGEGSSAVYSYGSLGGSAVGATRSFFNTPIYDSRTQSPYFGQSYTAQSPGVTYGQALQTGAAAAGAALAAYGVYQGAARGQNTSYLEGAGTGALVGAVYGTTIAPGIGTAIGLVAGALIGALGANASQADYDKQHRRAQRTRDAGRIAQGVLAALGEAETVAISDILQRRLVSGNTVGGTLLGLARHMNEQELITFLLDYGAAAESFVYERLGSFGELIAYLRPDGVRQLLDVALAMFRREAELEQRIIVGQEEVITRGGQRATVQTFLPLSRRSELRLGLDTFLYQGQGDAAEIERFLFRLVAHADRRGIRVFRGDEGGLVYSRTVSA